MYVHNSNLHKINDLSPMYCIVSHYSLFKGISTVVRKLKHFIRSTMYLDM